MPKQLIPYCKQLKAKFNDRASVVKTSIDATAKKRLSHALEDVSRQVIQEFEGGQKDD